MRRLLQHWTLDALISLIGIVSIVFFFLSLTTLTGWHVSQSLRRNLIQHALTLATTVAEQSIDPLLTDDTYAVFALLRGMVVENADVRYVYVVRENGETVCHTFADGFPVDLLDAAPPTGEPWAYRAADDYLIEVRVPLLDGAVGTLRLGVSQRSLIRQQRRFYLLMTVASSLLLIATLWVAQLIGDMVGRPLRALAVQARAVPAGQVMPEDLTVGGTAEVAEVGQAFQAMVRDLRQLEQENRVAQQRMVSAERLAALGELAAGLAHEIINPLDGVLACCHQLRPETEHNAKLARYLLLIEDGLSRIDRVMRQMLVFARSREETMSLAANEVGEMLQNVLELAQGRLQQCGVEIAVNVESQHCLCHRSPVEQVFLNLILNAVDATSAADPARLAIRLQRDGEWLCIHFDDNGPGVCDERRERVFTPFFTTKEVGQGTGLGLTISRQLARQCGGDLVLADAPSPLGGARFSVFLPVAGSSTPAAGEAEGPG